MNDLGDLKQTTTELQILLQKQRDAFNARRGPIDYQQRVEALDKFLQALQDKQQAFCDACNEDFGGRSSEETLLLELFVLMDEIRHTKAHLKKWMKPKSVRPNWQFLPSRTQYVYQPLGVVGVMGAWNYQLLLSFSPMIGAMSAGNHVMVKPSELAPKTAALMARVVADCFPPEYVTVVNGDAEMSAAFSALPFDHLIFTGSTRIGKLVMKAASDNLTPVTLELGGKSPAIIGEDYPIDSAVRKILHGKMQNAGQTCVAPDYVLVHEDELANFISQAEKAAATFYPKLVDNADYTRIISQRHYQRLQDITTEAIGRGAQVTVINSAAEDCNIDNKVFPLTLIANAPDDCTCMREELFGPILPIKTYKTLDEAIDYVNANPRPLALYYFDNNKNNQQKILAQTIAGGVTLNGCIYHLPQNNLPFGGVGDSGMGAYHGLDGFHTFSKKKPVFIQSKWALTMFMRPPYGKLARFMIRFLLTNRPSFRD